MFFKVPAYCLCSTWFSQITYLKLKITTWHFFKMIYYFSLITEIWNAQQYRVDTAVAWFKKSPGALQLISHFIFLSLILVFVWIRLFISFKSMATVLFDTSNRSESGFSKNWASNVWANNLVFPFAKYTNSFESVQY